MAQLPPDGEWLVQNSGTEVFVIHRYSEEEVCRFDATNQDATAKAQYTIYQSDKLSAEQKCFAHFWCGYFHNALLER
jgi:hypothetical protein